MNSNENLHRRLSVFEKYREMIFLFLVSGAAGYLFNYVVKKLDIIDDRLYRIEMNTNDLTRRMTLAEEYYKDIREDIINIYDENKKLEHRIIILEQRGGL